MTPVLHERLVFVDRLTVVTLMRLLPLLFVYYHRSCRMVLRYFSASPPAAALLDFMHRAGWVTGMQFDYAYENVRDESGCSLAMRVEFEDTFCFCEAVHAEFFKDHPLIRLLAKHFDSARLSLYLEKAVVSELIPLLVRINAVSWYVRTACRPQEVPPRFFAEPMPWRRLLVSYALERDIRLGWIRCAPVRIPWTLIRRISMRLLKGVFSRLRTRHTKAASHIFERDAALRHPVTIAMPYAGKGLTTDLSRNTDLFWQPFVPLERNQLLVFFTRSDDPLNKEKWDWLKKHSMRAVALTPAARSDAHYPLWQPDLSLGRVFRELTRFGYFVRGLLQTSSLFSGSGRWMAGQLIRFTVQYLYWSDFFKAFNVRLLVDHDDWSRQRLAADEALAHLGSISVSYQRSDESLASVHWASSVDVNFSFSHHALRTERRSRSRARYLVGAGYTHDHAFSRVHERSRALRKKLEDRGARFVVCYFDQSSYGDPRMGYSHAFQEVSYRFLLKQLLADPRLGLIIKPKKPRTLRARMGRTAVLMDEALATGRFMVFDEGIVATPDLPCEASEAADAAIGILAPTTAALESVLAGTRTLLLDREGCKNHPLYKYDLKDTIFSEWEPLWTALERYRKNPARSPEFGSWGLALDRMDPFRDGRAAERIGTYMHWLLEGLRKGHTADEALSMAAVRYGETWNTEKVANLRTARSAENKRETTVHER